MNKKGSIQDIIYVMIVILVISVVSLITFRVSSEVNDQFQESSLISSRGKTSVNKVNDIYPNVLDTSYMLLIIGLALATLVLAALVRVHPMFFIFFIVVLLITIFLGGVFSNVYQGIASQTGFSELADQLVFMSFTMQYLPMIIGILGFALAFIMYKNYQGAQ